MQGLEILLVSALVTLSQGKNSSRFPNWQSAWIEGGENAAPGEFPYMALITRSEAQGVRDSGGSIVNNWYILTAAHVVSGTTTPKIKVMVGTNKLNSGGQTYRISRIIIHEAYDPSTTKNDIALLELMKPIVYSPTVQPVILSYHDDRAASGTICIFTGYGLTSKSPSSHPNNVQKLQFKITANSNCRKYYKYVFDTDICAKAGTGRGTCRGDSGGPLVCGGKQVGINKGGGGKGSICSHPLPVIFTNVQKYIGWIKQNAVELYTSFNDLHLK